eukprot:11514062-Alexandrium_andersonii.AAC.1
MAVKGAPEAALDCSSAAAVASGPSSSRVRGRARLVDLRVAGFSLRRCAPLTSLVTSTTARGPSV